MPRSLQSLIHKIKRAIFWAKSSWNFYDYDYTTVYKVLHLQLKRTYDIINSDPYHIRGRNDEHIKKIAQAVEISRRLSEACKKMQDGLTNDVFNYTEDLKCTGIFEDLGIIKVLNKAGLEEAAKREKYLQQRLNKLLEHNLGSWWV